WGGVCVAARYDDGREGGGGGQGSGFVVNQRGEIVTNAHVVTTGDRELRRASQLFVQFSDGNRVDAQIVGEDPNADIALIRIDPDGLDLRPLALGASDDVQVGQ